MRLVPRGWFEAQLHDRGGPNELRRVQLTYPSHAVRGDERERESRKRNDCSRHNILTRTSRAALATMRRARQRAFASITAALTAATSQTISRGSHGSSAINSLRSTKKTSEYPLYRLVRLSRRRSARRRERACEDARQLTRSFNDSMISHMGKYR
jgi:hypothetical protein